MIKEKGYFTDYFVIKKSIKYPKHIDKIGIKRYNNSRIKYEWIFI